MKNYISLIALFPLFLFSMDDMRGPIVHRTEDYLKSAVRKYSFEDINKLTVDELSNKMESLLQDNDFRTELPVLIQEGNALIDDIEKNTGLAKCKVYSACCVKTTVAGCISGCIAHATGNIDLGTWTCLAGTGMACYQCNTKLRRNSQIQNDLLEKNTLLLGHALILQQSLLNTLMQQYQHIRLAEAAEQQAGAAHPVQDQYDFSYTEEHP